jgi:hypothetical protein
VNIAIARRHNRLEYTFEGDWNWKQFYDALQPVQLLRGTGSADIVVDMRTISQLPMDAVLHLKPAVQMAERHDGKYVIIAKGSAAQTLFLSFTSIYSSLAARCFLVSSMEEADALLRKPDNGQSLARGSA